jgi:hypothetical protein
MSVSRFSRASLTPFAVALLALGPFACGGDDQTQFGAAGGSTSAAGKGGNTVATEGCGDLVACCLELEGDERASCQNIATAFAGQENGDQNCVVALGGYRKNGACSGSPAAGGSDPGDGGTGGTDGAAGSSNPGTGGISSGSGGTGGTSAGKGGSTSSKGGSGGSSSGKGGSSGTGGTGGTSAGKGGSGGTSTGKGGTGGTGGSGGGTAGTGGTGGTGGGPISTDETAACQQWAQAFCGRFAACGKGALLEVYESEADCIAREAADACPIKFFGPSSWTPAGVSACANAFGGLDCAQVGTVDLPAECEAPPGQVEKGGACVSHGDCQSGRCSNGLVYFFSTAFLTAGTCEELIEDGAPCGLEGMANTECRSYRCDDVTKTCRPRDQQPTKCSESNRCSLGYGCNEGNGFCAPLKTEGQPCGTSKTACSGFLGLSCEGGVCAFPSGLENGDSCTIGDFCTRGAYCKADIFTGGSCLPQAEGGQPCSDGGGVLPFTLQSPCRYPFICNGATGDKTCQAPSP